MSMSTKESAQSAEVSPYQSDLQRIVFSIASEIRQRNSDSSSRDNARDLSATIDIAGKEIVVSSYGYTTKLSLHINDGTTKNTSFNEKSWLISTSTDIPESGAMNLKEAIRFVNLLHYGRYYIDNFVPATNERQNIRMVEGGIVISQLPREDDLSLGFVKNRVNKILKHFHIPRGLLLISRKNIPQAHHLSQYIQDYLTLYLARRKTQSRVQQITADESGDTPDDLGNIGAGGTCSDDE